MNQQQSRIDVDDMMWEICGIELELEKTAKNAKGLKEMLKNDDAGDNNNNNNDNNNNNNLNGNVFHQNDVSMFEK